MTSYHMDDHLGAMLLSKRGCVSDCVVPSCTSIQCSDTEACILSAQTCDACPAVSCVSLELTVTTQHINTEFPKGAIAGIVIAALLLILAAMFLFYKIRQRRRTILEIDEKLAKGRTNPDLEQNEIYDEKSRRASDVVSITIGISEELAMSPTTVSSPHLPGDHFFSADELLRMSYADSVASDTRSSHHSTLQDQEAAMIQRTNSTATAMRAKVFQYSRSSALGLHATSTDGTVQQHLTLTQQSTTSTCEPRSCWEDDKDSVLSSPIERDMIPRDKFELRRSDSSRSRVSARRLSSTSGRSLMRVDSNTLAASSRHSTISRRSEPASGEVVTQTRASSVTYDWHDPSQLPGGDDDN